MNSNKQTSARSAKPREVGAVVTLKDIAKVARVSAQTVSCVINNTGSVSDGLRKQIRQIAAELGYLPNRSAKTMRTGRSQTLGEHAASAGHAARARSGGA